MALQLSQTGHVVEDLIERGLSQVLHSIVKNIEEMINHVSKLAAFMRSII